MWRQTATNNCTFYISAHRACHLTFIRSKGSTRPSPIVVVIHTTTTQRKATIMHSYGGTPQFLCRLSAVASKTDNLDRHSSRQHKQNSLRAETGHHREYPLLDQSQPVHRLIHSSETKAGAPEPEATRPDQHHLRASKDNGGH